MEFRQLKTFLIISKFNSFTMAADELGYAQSTVTTQIKLLEDELNVKLFERLGKTISLTQEGQKLKEYAEKLLLIEKEIKSNIYASKEPCGTLIIGAAESLCYDRVPMILREYKLRYPKVDIIIKFGTCATFPDMLKNNKIDLAYSFGEKIENKEIAVFHEKKEKMAFLISDIYMGITKDSICEEDLISNPLLLTPKECANRKKLMNVLKKHNIVPKCALETESKAVLKQFAINGFGIAYMPEMIAYEEIKEKKLKKLEWVGEDIDVYSQLIYHKERTMTPAIKAFLDIFSELLISN